MAAPKPPQSVIDRNPRFALLTNEVQSLQFWRQGSSKACTKAKVKNISNGGLAFFTSAEELPEVGESIWVELQVLHVQPAIRRHGRVLRVEKTGEDPVFSTVVALKFEADPVAGLRTGADVGAQPAVDGRWFYIGVGFVLGVSLTLILLALFGVR